MDALTYSADVGIDMVNMSFYTDPWLYSCASNPADSPAEQLEQRTIVVATPAGARVRPSARRDARLGGREREHRPRQPDLRADLPQLPAGRGTRADGGQLLPHDAYRGARRARRHGARAERAQGLLLELRLEQSDLSAAGGDRRDFFGTSLYNSPGNRVLAPYPKSLAEADGVLNPDGTPNTPLVLADCSKGPCAYYQYLQGTSMASPHAVGGAALVVSSRGVRDPRRGGLTLDPSVVERVLERTARDHACPTYPDPDLGPEYTAVCRGGPEFNGFYGHGIVDAFAVAGRR